MSRRKRRKRNSKDKKDEITDPFKRFQTVVVKSLDPFQSCKIFCGSWKLVVQNEWWASSGEELVVKVKKACGRKPKNKYHPLYRALKYVNFPILKKIYTDHFKNRQKKIRREITVWEIIYKFFGEETPLEKRENEKSNLSEIKNLEETIRFIDLCNITVPNEIIRIIFSFIPKTLPYIFRVGKVCKLFYISFLCSWEHVKVRKRNVYKIPIIVLNSVSSIDIWSGLLHSDLDYLWPKLKPEKFRSLFLCGKTERVFKSLKKYHKQCTEKKNVYSLQNVVEIRFRGGTFFWKDDYVSLFPSGIGSLLGYPSSHLTHHCPSQKLSFKSMPKLSDLFVEGEEMKEEEIVDILKENYEKVVSLSLGTVELNNFDLPKPDHFARTIECFPNIEELSFYQDTNTITDQSSEGCFDLSVFNNSICLKKLKIGKGFEESYKSYRKGNGILIPVKYDLKNLSLEELKIDSSSSSSKIIDFNCEDLISSNLLSSNNHNLKRFYAEIPLCSRKRFPHGIQEEYIIQKWLCNEIGNTINNLMEFMRSTMIEKYETFHLKLVVPIGWRRIQRWSVLYEKRIKRVKMKMYIASAHSYSDRGDYFQNIDLSDEEISSEDFLFRGKMPVLLLLTSFIRNVLPKISRRVNLVEFESFEVLGPGKSKLSYKVFEFLRSYEDESIVYDEETMSFLNVSVL